jgi:hypothetical protein
LPSLPAAKNTGFFDGVSPYYEYQEYESSPRISRKKRRTVAEETKERDHRHTQLDEDNELLKETLEECREMLKKLLPLVAALCLPEMLPSNSARNLRSKTQRNV